MSRLISILSSKTTWLSVVLFSINALEYFQTLSLTPQHLQEINTVLGILVFINRHYLPSSINTQETVV